MWEFIKTTLIYLIFPPMCPVCREIVDERGELCENCSKKIFRLDYKKNPPEILEKVFCITKYREGTQKMLHRLKFDKDLRFLPTLKKILNSVSKNSELKNFLAQVDIATFVPLHTERMAERGYNQTDLIFRDFLTEKNIPIENLLIRSKFTKKLFDLSPDERKKVLLVDDIYTTGSTTSECAQVLKNFGAEEIFVLAFSSDGD